MKVKILIGLLVSAIAAMALVIYFLLGVLHSQRRVIALHNVESLESLKGLVFVVKVQDYSSYGDFRQVLSEYPEGKYVAELKHLNIAFVPSDKGLAIFDANYDLVYVDLDTGD